MQTTKQESPKGCSVLAVLLVVLPVIVFYAILIQQSFNLPLLPDDYHALLHPVTDLETISSTPAKLSYWLAAQHNEYKLWFEVAVAYVQSSISGQINFRFLDLLGDAFLIPLALMVWNVFRLPTGNRASRLLWFAPASILLFQLADFETLDWAMAGLQNLPVIVFAFSAILLLFRRNWKASTLAAACLVLSVASSGNGFLLVPVGCFLLLRQRRYTLLGIWLVLALVLVAGYAYHYNTLSSQVAQHRSVFTTLFHLNPIYVLAFLGSVGGLHGCVPLGLVITGANAYLLYQGFYRRHPQIGYLTLFILFTAIGVAGIRSELGLVQACSSRYRIYCMLLLCFLWFSLAERALTWTQAGRRRLLVGTLLITSVFAAREDRHGYQCLRDRQNYAREGIHFYEQSLRTGSNLGPVAWQSDQEFDWVSKNDVSRQYLMKAQQVGTFRLPE